MIWNLNDGRMETKENKVTEISGESTDTQYPSAKCVFDAIMRAGQGTHYTMRWDKTLSQGVRLNSAADITTDITNFCHRGTRNTSLSNPFDNIYPWSDITLCNIDIDHYAALTAGDSIQDCVVAWYGDPDFSMTHTNGVWRYRPEFWAKCWDDGGYRYFDVSPIERADYVHYAEAVEGRWFGSIVTLTISGTSKTCLIPKLGMPGKNVAMFTLHQYAKNWGASIEDIYSYSATNVLMFVEFATMNTQNAIGLGVSSLYCQSSDTIQEDAVASATVKVLKENASMCIVGAIMDIGTTSDGAQVGSFIIGSVEDDTDDDTLRIVSLTTDGTTAASVTVTTADFWSIHGLSNTVDADIGKDSGFIGVNGESHAYYRGQVAHANMFRYVIGAYRQQNTGEIFVANNADEADDYDALNTAVHKDTGCALLELGGYINELHEYGDIPGAPFYKSRGGNSTNPVGDFCYTPVLSAGNTCLLLGGFANVGAYNGRNCASWSGSADHSCWNVSAVPTLKQP